MSQNDDSLLSINAKTGVVPFMRWPEHSGHHGIEPFVWPGGQYSKNIRGGRIIAVAGPHFGIGILAILLSVGF